MDLNRLEGTVKDLAGRAEQAYGEAAGDAKSESRGYARQAEGRAQNVYGQAVDQLRDAADEVSYAVERNPIGALLVAGAVGYVLALLTRR